MTRLLKTPIVARAGTASISSCIDRLGGESMACTLRMPPDFCAKLGTMPNADTTSAAAVNARRPRYIPRLLPLQPAVGGPLFGLLHRACDLTAYHPSSRQSPGYSDTIGIAPRGKLADFTWAHRSADPDRVIQIDAASLSTPRARLIALPCFRSWPLPATLTDRVLEAMLYASAGAAQGGRRKAGPDWTHVHRELRRPGVTLMLLWEEYRASEPGGYCYSRWCELYRAWEGRLSPTMRQSHPAAGERMFVDFDGRSGEIRQAQIFVAVMGASSYTYAEASWTQSLPG